MYLCQLHNMQILSHVTQCEPKIKALSANYAEANANASIGL